ncbi:hypothetical protein EUX98_g8316 [Antrodiella citrinella]|uniref:Uncharacterized protein n=1 Tax=Antrodiella citrinella TaxID=2447956 RepID=A0A4V3XGJ1_9APHY|nr:hypothetical protein EUX98_g8316 [Antrodiella citrinella]
MPPNKPQGNTTPFFVTTYERIVISFNDLITAITDSQRDTIANNFTAIAVMPLGAGPMFMNKHPEIHNHIRDFVVGLKIAEETQYEPTVYLLETRYNHTHKTVTDALQAYAKPWSLILTGVGLNIKDYLLWFQTFAIAKDLVFSFVPYDQSLQSWVITDIGADPALKLVVPGIETKMIVEVKTKLWKDDNFRWIVDNILGQEGVEGSACERVAIATSSLTIQYIAELGDSNGKKCETFQLRGKPITADTRLHAEWLSAIRLVVRTQCRFNGYAKFNVVRTVQFCHARKADTHPTELCPSLHIEHWSDQNEAATTFPEFPAELPDDDIHLPSIDEMLRSMDPRPYTPGEFKGLDKDNLRLRLVYVHNKPQGAQGKLDSIQQELQAAKSGLETLTARDQKMLLGLQCAMCLETYASPRM